MAEAKSVLQCFSETFQGYSPDAGERHALAGQVKTCLTFSLFFALLCFMLGPFDTIFMNFLFWYWLSLFLLKDKTHTHAHT